LNETNAVRLQSVKVGDQIGANWIIESGLKPGDRVIAEGTQKAKAGTVVNPRPFADPSSHPPEK
jgi:membrane fusion protein (multidrug efflux system)